MSDSKRSAVSMTPDEINDFIASSQTATLSTFNHDGTIHSVAMWYGFADDVLSFNTRPKSQKAKNLQRNPQVTCLIWSGTEYNELKGVEIVGEAVIIEDGGERLRHIRSAYERNINANSSSEDARLHMANMAASRLIVTLTPRRIVSWDHAKAPRAGRVPESARRPFPASLGDARPVW